MFYYLKTFFCLISFDKFEKLYLSNTIKINTSSKQTKKKVVLIEIIPDYYYLSYFTCIANERFKDCYLIGYWPDVINTNQKSYFFIFRLLKFLRSNIFHYLLKKKWKKLYSKLNIQEFYDYRSLKNMISNNEIQKIEKETKDIYKKINRKEDILKIKIDNLHVGDLIYDTYIRFRNEATVDLNDKFIYEIIKRSGIFIKSFKNLIQSKKIKDLYFPYSSYVVHGIPSRLAIKLNKHVYTDGNYQYNKKLSKSDLRHVENVNNLKKIFRNLKQKSKKKTIAKKLIQNFFYSKNIKSTKALYNYMNSNSYNSKYDLKNIDSKYEIVIFLPNFFESQREWGKIIFNDFYEWIIFTLNYFQKMNVKVALKPHPNIFSLHPENKKIIEILKNKYKNFIWIDPKYPNKEIFKKIKLAISPWGSVLWELAYFNIASISIGDNPGKQYNLSLNPRNILEYKYLLKNYKKLKNVTKKENIYEFIYVYMLNNNDAYQSIARQIELKKIDFTFSNGLENFIRKFKYYEKKNKKK